MRKTLVILIFLLVLAALAFVALPGKQGVAWRAEVAGRYSKGGVGELLNGFTDAAVLELSHKRLTELTDLAERQIAAEIATLESIKSGQISLQATKPEKSRPRDHAVDNDKKIKPSPQLPATAPASQPVPQPAPVDNPPATVAPPGTEEAFTGLIKHEPRGPVPESDPFWTEERKREALENGEPGANKRACLFFCKKSN